MKNSLNKQSQSSQGYKEEEFDLKLNEMLAKLGTSAKVKDRVSSPTNKPKTYEVTFRKPKND